ncbi:hypothetical protein CVT25_013613 [Psilocybe cyanescens]|uniref:Uncharacterized protein n=1 Tax=Psilocybe cyanescens TaxID=93625 RepID=A0A409VYW1_PSICY|nr:hypothetical protein CVT25_013613 [Psilocybe cyanescens]
MSIITALLCTKVHPNLETISLSISHPVHCKLKSYYSYKVNACIPPEAPDRIQLQYDRGFELSSDGDEERVQTLLKNTKEVFEVWMDINNVPMYQMGGLIDGDDEE